MEELHLLDAKDDTTFNAAHPEINLSKNIAKVARLFRMTGGGAHDIMMGDSPEYFAH